MKKSRLSSGVIFLCFFIFAAAIAGGCGGGGTDKAARQGVTLSFDTDNDGYADVFDEYPLDPKRNWMDEISLDVVQTASNASAASAQSGGVNEVLPQSHIKGVIPAAKTATANAAAAAAENASSEAPKEPLSVTFKAKLETNKQYCFAFDPDAGDRAAHFIFDLRIYDPSGDEVSTIHTVALAEDLGFIGFTFKSAQAGSYTVKVSNQDPYDNQAQPFDLYIFEEKGEPGNYGHLVRYTDSDGGDGFIYTLRDIIVLRRALDAHAVSWDQYNRPIKYVEGIERVWDAALYQVNTNHLKNVAAPVSSGSAAGSAASNGAAYETADESDYYCELDPVITGIDWNSERYSLGYGYIAPTGIRAKRNDAVEKFTEPDKTSGPRTNEYMRFIRTKEEHEEELNVSAKASYGTADAGIEASSSYAQNIKYSETSTTITLHYDRYEDEYRVLRPSEYKLTSAAKEYLDTNGAEAFRGIYGDYFAAGARYGASFVAYVAIKTTSSEKIEEIQAALKGAYSGVEASAEFSKKFKDATEGCTITVEKHTVGGGSSSSRAFMTASGGWSGSSSDAGEFGAGVSSTNPDDVITALFEDMKEFKDKVEGSDALLVKKHVYLMNFNQIQGGENLPYGINLHPEHFKALKKMTREWLGLKNYQMQIKDIPTADFVNGQTKKNTYLYKFDDLQTELETEMSKICGSYQNVIAETNKIIALSEEFRALVERHSFTTKLRAAAVKQGKRLIGECGGGQVRVGFTSYPLSDIVNADIEKYDAHSDTHYEDIVWAWDEGAWNPSWDTGYGYRVVSFWACSWWDNYRTDDDNYSSLGKDKIKLSYAGKRNYDVNWEYSVRRIYIGDNYPFIWMHRGNDVQ